MARDPRRRSSSQESPGEKSETSPRVVELLNQSQLSGRDGKLNCLGQVQELILNRDLDLLDVFLEEFLAYHHDRHPDVRRLVVAFMEEAGKRDSYHTVKFAPLLSYLLHDESPPVVKKVVQSSTFLYKVALKLVVGQRQPSEPLSEMWKVMSEVRAQIQELLQTSNDGVRTLVIKFLEMIVLTHSAKTELSEVPKNMELDVSLDMIAHDHPFIKLADFKSSCGVAFESLLTLTTSQSISSVNLMACIACLANISRQRPGFMSVVAQALESLHANMSPTYTKSHTNSVQKNLKTQLLSFLRHPASGDIHSELVPLLIELGCPPAEIDKNKLKVDSSKRPRSDRGSLPAAKKTKLQTDEDGSAVAGMTMPAVDMTFEDILPLLTPERVADIVFCTMERLPDVCQETFITGYVPEDNPGTSLHIGFLARMLATQMTSAGVGVGMQKTREKLLLQTQTQRVGSQLMASDGTKLSEMSRGGSQENEDWDKKDIVPRIRQQKQYILSDVTRKNLDVAELQQMTSSAMKRIQVNEKAAARGGTLMDRIKLMVSLATQLDGGCREALYDYVLSDLHLHYDVMLAWLYEEYAVAEGYKGLIQVTGQSTVEKYDKTVTDLLGAMKDQLDAKDKMFTRLLLDLPRIPPVVLDIVQSYCEDEDRVVLGVATMRDLILSRPAVQEQFLGVLLQLTGCQKENVRIQAIHVAKRLHSKDLLSPEIERFACEQLDCLVTNFPTGAENSEAADAEIEQLDDSIYVCLQLFIGLLPLNHSLIHKLSAVYVEVSASVKKVILRMLDHAVRAMGMHSPDIHKFIETCPQGAETLLIRILHILTERAAPLHDIVRRVRELYRKQIPDVRVLVPILNVLDKREVMAALPQLIKQSSAVVKEGFGRLLGIHRGTGAGRSPVTAQELMVAMHNIDVSEEDTMKAAMKAITLLFQERAVYTQEVLSVVLHQLMDLTPLPTLFMRTVIQARQACPRLIPFIMNILSRLITKQVWKQPSVWQGFVKCCQMTKPQSFQIMLQLPPRHLQSVFEISADLKEQLKAHISSFTPHQRGLIPRAILQVIEKETKKKSVRKTRGSAKAQDPSAALTEQAESVAVEDLSLDTEPILEEETVADELEGAALRKSEVDDPGYEQEQELSGDVQQMETGESLGDDDSVPLQS